MNAAAGELDLIRRYYTCAAAPASDDTAARAAARNSDDIFLYGDTCPSSAAEHACRHCAAHHIDCIACDASRRKACDKSSRERCRSRLLERHFVDCRASACRRSTDDIIQMGCCAADEYLIFSRIARTCRLSAHTVAVYSAARNGQRILLHLAGCTGLLNDGPRCTCVHRAALDGHCIFYGISGCIGSINPCTRNTGSMRFLKAYCIALGTARMRYTADNGAARYRAAAHGGTISCYDTCAFGLSADNIAKEAGCLGLYNRMVVFDCTCCCSIFDLSADHRCCYSATRHLCAVALGLARCTDARDHAADELIGHASLHDRLVARDIARCSTSLPADSNTRHGRPRRLDGEDIVGSIPGGWRKTCYCIAVDHGIIFEEYLVALGPLPPAADNITDYRNGADGRGIAYGLSIDTSAAVNFRTIDGSACNADMIVRRLACIGRIATPDFIRKSASRDADTVPRHLARTSSMSARDNIRDTAACNIDNVPLGAAAAHIVPASDLSANTAVIDGDGIISNISRSGGRDNIAASDIIRNRSAPKRNFVARSIPCRIGTRNTPTDEIIGRRLLEVDLIARSLSCRSLSPFDILQCGRRSADRDFIRRRCADPPRKSTIGHTIYGTARNIYLVPCGIACAL